VDDGVVHRFDVEAEAESEVEDDVHLFPSKMC
jgi:hypothetical protein